MSDSAGSFIKLQRMPVAEDIHLHILLALLSTILSFNTSEDRPVCLKCRSRQPQLRGSGGLAFPDNSFDFAKEKKVFLFSPRHIHYFCVSLTYKQNINVSL